MAAKIVISEAHYDFLLTKAKEQILREFNNDGNWVTRELLIAECIDNEMPEDFISDLHSDQSFQINIERSDANESARQFKQSAL